MFEGLFVAMVKNLLSCFLIHVLEQFLKFFVNFTLLEKVKSQRCYGFLIINKLIFWLRGILDFLSLFSLLKGIIHPSNI